MSWKKHIVLIVALVFCYMINLTGDCEASAEPWYINDSPVTGYKPVITMGDQAIAYKINSDINNFIYSRIQYFKNGGFNQNIRFDYEVTYEDEDVISILMYTYGFKQIKVFHTLWSGLTYDKRTGSRCSIKYFVNLKGEDVARLKLDSLYDVNVTARHCGSKIEYKNIRTDFELNRVYDNYYLVGGGDLVMIMPSYGIGEEGAFLGLRLDLGQIKYYTIKNK